MVRALPPQVMNVAAVVVMAAGPGQQQDWDRSGMVTAGGVLRGTAQYRGGSEGQSCYQWQRLPSSSSSQGEWQGIEGAIRQGYTVVDADRGYTIRFGICPVSIDGVSGEWTFSALTSVS